MRQPTTTPQQQGIEIMADAREPPPKKSMREFDYFREEAVFSPAAQNDTQQLRIDRARRRVRTHAVLIALFTAILGYFAYGFVELFLYHYRALPQVDLGRAEEMEGKTWPVGRFVRVKGVTENRGAQAQFMRGLEGSEKFWYVHLLGSPLFVEMPSTVVKGKIEPFADISVEGRLVDLSQANEYQRVVQFFRESLLVTMPEHGYLLQVDLKPNQLWRYIMLFVGAAAITLMNALIWWRALRKLHALERAKLTLVVSRN